jgi:hypothetical protein
MQIFSEITAKLRLVTHSTRQSILINLIPWVYNLELVDNNIVKTASGVGCNNKTKCFAFLTSEG